MLHITSTRSVAVGISALAVAAAGIATLALGADRGAAPATAGTPAGRTAPAADNLSRLAIADTFRATPTGSGESSAVSGPAAATRITDRPAGPVQSAAAPRAASSAVLPRPAHTPLVKVGVEGPVTAQVSTDDVLTTAASVVTTVRNTVSWANGTVHRTVSSLPVKATVTTGPGGTDVNASVLGVSAGAHVG